MLKKITIALTLVAGLLMTAEAQKIKKDQGNVQANFGFDVYRTPGSDFGNIQPSLDLNYFAANNFAVGLGFNYSSGLKTAALEPGVRLYPFGGMFLRTRAFVPTKFNWIDVSAGLGYDWALSDKWAIETNADYYLRSKSTVLRMGIALFL